MDNFINTLNYLGGKLGLSPKSERFVDLEIFFLQCSLNFNKDERIKQTILNWLFEYGMLLSPSKIRRVMNEFDHDVDISEKLTVFLIEHNKVHLNWKILLGNSKKKSNIKFKENRLKYLKNKNFILKDVPEIRFRAEGRSQVIADIMSYVSKSHFKSLYELAKNIHSPRNRVNESYRQLNSFGIL